MDLAHAIAAGGLAGRTAQRRFSSTEAEIRAAERRVARRRTAAAAAASAAAAAAATAAASVAHEYPERGRHAAPRPARA